MTEFKVSKIEQTVEYVKAATTVAGLAAVQAKYAGLPIICAEPSSFRRQIA